MNKLVLSGQVSQLDTLRHTPAGLPLLSFTLRHASENEEAGMKRKVECEVKAVIIGDLANSEIQVGANLMVQGFLAKRSAKSSQLVLHIQNLKFI